MEQHNHGMPACTMDGRCSPNPPRQRRDPEYEITKRYHIKFGNVKSQILTIGNTEVTPNLKLGDETIDPTSTWE